MGKGIALEFKIRYPTMFSDYVARCEQHEVRLREPYLYRLTPRQLNLLAADQATSPELILKFPTKKHWKSRSRVDEIERGLACLMGNAADWGITSLAMPPLGCGNGGLNWNVVGPLMYRYLSELGLPVELYPPQVRRRSSSSSRLPSTSSAAKSSRRLWIHV